MSDYTQIDRIIKSWKENGATHWIYLAKNGKTYHTYRGSHMLPKEVSLDERKENFTMC